MWLNTFHQVVSCRLGSRKDVCGKTRRNGEAKKLVARSKHVKDQSAVSGESSIKPLSSDYVTSPQ